jgi:hypothetical protein
MSVILKVILMKSIAMCLIYFINLTRKIHMEKDIQIYKVLVGSLYENCA